MRQRRSRSTRSRIALRRLQLEGLEDRRPLALSAELVADINTQFNAAGSSPSNFIDVSGTTFFLAGTDTAGGLWRTDGSAAGTQIVRDVPSISQLTNVNGKLFFSADRGDGKELWSSDGTTAGTRLVRNLSPLTSNGSNPDDLVNVNGTLYFTADDFVAGRELWKSDGTEAGTTLVKDIRPGSGASTPDRLINVGGVLYFFVLGGVNGSRPGLWTSDGSEAGTQEVKNFSIDTLEPLTNVGGTMYFAGFDAGGSELWKSDGTPGGTGRVKDIRPGSGSSSPQSLLNVNGTLYFTADDGTSGRELWRTDGTDAGTVMVQDIRPGTASSEASGLTNLNGVLLFSARHDGGAFGLWRSDGTTAGTFVLRNANTNPGLFGLSSLTNVGGTLFFVGGGSGSGNELWSSDGTAAGTALFKELVPGTGSPSATQLANIGGTLFFQANAGGIGAELWKSDRTPEGTVLVKDIRAGTKGSGANFFANAGGTLVFSADNGSLGYELWRSNGTSAGTQLVLDITANPPTGSAPRYPVQVGGTVFFSAMQDGPGLELWKTDGTTAGTVLVKNISGSGSDNQPSVPRYLTNVNGTLYFQASDNGFDNFELWKSDGTEAGTVLVEDIVPGNTEGSDPSMLINSNGILYFRANWQLWRSGPGGTEQVSGAPSSPGYLTDVNGTVFLAGSDSAGYLELWKTGPGGTVQLTDLTGNVTSLSPRDMVNVNGTLFFRGRHPTSFFQTYELWKSDGTPGGTVAITDNSTTISTGFQGFAPKYLTNVNNTLYFAAKTDAGGVELWKSDGTTTVLVKDIWPGADSSSPYKLQNVNGRLFFQANDGLHGAELWTSDGTEAGTYLVADVNPGSPGSYPRNVICGVGDEVFFAATDELHGRELWRVTPSIAPILGNLTGVSFADNDPPVLLAATGTVIDADSADFAGGTLTIQIAANGDAADLLAIVNQGMAAGEIGASGANVFYGGVSLGTSAGGTSGSDLVITLNAGASQAAVQALLRCITFSTAQNTAATGTRSIRVQLSDGDGATSQPQTVEVDIVTVNDAPVLDNSPNVTLSAFDEDVPNLDGALVSGVLSGAVTDPDVGAQAGMAVIAVSGNGTWQYTIDGGTNWLPFGAVSETTARLLPSNLQAKVRFLPNTHYNGQARIDYRAWDQTAGVAGETFDASATGGSTAFSEAAEFATQTINPVNDAPVLNTAGSPALPTLVEDSTTNNGEFIYNLLGSAMSDPDGSFQPGVAITSVGESGGSWQYTLDGTNWLSLTGASQSSARLLPASASAKVRFLPNPDFSGSATISYHAWDRTQGASGDAYDISGKLGGTNAFSTAFESAAQSVTAVNDAPVLATSPNPSLGTIAEDTPAASNSGALVSSIIGGISDVDPSALRGIAVTGLTEKSRGTWEFSTNSTTWAALGDPSDSAARLLVPANRVRFRPALNYNGTPQLKFRAWDRSNGLTAGSIGSTVGAQGGSAAYSDAVVSAKLTVTPVNDAPVLAASPQPTLGTLAEDSTAATISGVPVANLLGGVTDVDAQAQQGIAVTGLSEVNFGAWQFSTDGGASWTALGNPSEATARLLRSADLVRFVPGANYNGAPQLTFRAWDQSNALAGGAVSSTVGQQGGEGTYSSNTATATLTVTPVNDAPVLSFGLTPSLNPIDEDILESINLGTSVADIVTGVTDVDAGALRGLAVVSLTEKVFGTWQFSIDNGSTWSALGTPSDSAARVLAPANLVRFVPAPQYFGTPQLKFRAWDQTDGTTPGSVVDVVGLQGGTAAYSAVALSAKLTVRSINDPPVLDTTVPRSLGVMSEDAPLAETRVSPVSEFMGDISDADAGALRGIAVVGLTEKVFGTWQYILDGGGGWKTFGSPSESAAVLLSPTNLVRFVPNPEYSGTPQLKFRAWDRSNGVAPGSVANTVGQQGGSGPYSAAAVSAKLSVVSVNDAPVLILSGTTSYVRDAAPIVLAPNAEVSDVDSSDFNGGFLKVRITTGASDSNRLQIGGGFTVEGTMVKLGTTVIGTLISNGVGTTNLMISFTSSLVTKTVVRDLVRAVTFKTVGGSAGVRSILFSVNDGDSSSSDEMTKTVNVS